MLRIAARGSEPRYCSKPPTEIWQQVSGKTGALLIGDAALEVEGRFAYELDLGQAWKEMTGLPFVFAVWVARPGAARRATTCMLLHALARGTACRARRRSRAAGRAARGGDAAQHARYLTESIRYALDDDALRGLREFLRRAAEARLLPPAELRVHRRGASAERRRRTAPRSTRCST